MNIERKVIAHLAFFFLVLFHFQPLFGDVRLPKLVSEGMVIQRDARVNSWSWTDVNEKVSFNFQVTRHDDVAEDEGKSNVTTPPFEFRLSDEKALWQAKKAAIVLTYDDGLDVHLDNVIPALDEFGFKGSFYISAYTPSVSDRMKDWKQAALNGHELGNHTLYHPCSSNGPDRSWVDADNDLNRYSTNQIVREIKMANTFLEWIDGKKERTFAYTCGDMETGEGSFVEAIKNQFLSMRGVQGELNLIDEFNLTNLYCFSVENGNADQMISWAKKAKEKNALLVILFHGVGGGHDLNVDLEKHNAFLQYLKDHQEDYWVTTLLDATKNALQVIETRSADN